MRNSRMKVINDNKELTDVERKILKILSKNETMELEQIEETVLNGFKDHFYFSDQIHAGINSLKSKGLIKVKYSINRDNWKKLENQPLTL